MQLNTVLSYLRHLSLDFLMRSVLPVHIGSLKETINMSVGTYQMKLIRYPGPMPNRLTVLAIS